MGFISYIKDFFREPHKLKELKDLQGIDFVDAQYHNLVIGNRVPGISITILKEGKPILQKGYGHSSLERKTYIDPKNTVFRIASISKCITGLALGKMVEEGILHWHDSFYHYVSYYPKKKYDFTLAQLASHTAGIRGYRGKEFALNKSYSIKDSIEVFKDDPLVFEPGNGYLYNSYDFVLLSLAMQEACGIPFEDYVREKILTPLGMKRTFTPREMNPSFSNRRKNLKTDFYTRNSTGLKKAVVVNNYYKLAGGGYLSTSGDIAKMGQAILEQKLLEKETYEQLLSAQTIHGKPTYYGLGFQVSEDTGGRAFVGHVGNSVGAYTNFFVYPKENVVISILINATDPKVQSYLDDTISAVLMENFP
ncbi:beta-lactamase family protein [Muricauda sp. SCSIO 64092]|uniref:serine hydrolase domain-containing protein n=1 Tax=Allomuricauda sp. SCSIO 64092 TaxID=2908842 RepID=UPI001FF663FE|nr:serine hydrolase domain-containing protein [Muricauda sp. SCSIO 64092]UOY07626.1 beta-lactamase family protein [Muricauda sp. SCSIO 64092]